MDLQFGKLLRIFGGGPLFRVLLLAAMMLPLVAASPARSPESATGVQSANSIAVNWASTDQDLVNWPSM
jgi:hypothetical protein